LTSGNALARGAVTRKFTVTADMTDVEGVCRASRMFITPMGASMVW
jgi:hypothetical protein